MHNDALYGNILDLSLSGQGLYDYIGASDSPNGKQVWYIDCYRAEGR